MNINEAEIVLKKYNKEVFHLQHAYTVSLAMGYFANKYGYDKELWQIVGLLHDIDYELYPTEHCVKARDLLLENGVSEDIIYSICSHGYGLTGTDCKPNHVMEKVLFTIDELTGLVGAAVRMRPSKSVKDMEVSSLKKKFKDKRFAEGCSREVIRQGAELMGVSLDELFEDVLKAMSQTEDELNSKMAKLS